MVLSDRLEVENIVRKYRRRFECSEYMFAEDSNLPRFCGESIKVLVLFLSNGRFRSSSNTFNALHSICTSVDDVFVDYCYFPYSEDVSLFDELNIPYVRGARSGFLIKDFDIVLVSVAVIKEAVNLPVIYNHDGIPFGIKGRKEQGYPLVVMGGSSSSVLSILCGDFKVDGVLDRSLVDYVTFGKGERSLVELLEWYKGGCIGILSNRFLDISKLDFKYNKGFIVSELSGQKALLDNTGKVDSDFSDKILNLDGSFCDRGDLLISSGCNGRGVCSFCNEGSIGGCWKEKPIEGIELDIFKLKSRVWCESVGIFSYNANYHTQIEHIAELTKRYFDRSSVLMGRADVYSYSNKYLDICKSLGSIKLSIAAEGVSNTIRNDFLNKRLSREELYGAVRNIMSNEILTLKINYILTGKESEDDFKEWLEDMQYFSDLRKSNNCSTRISLTITNLIIYDLTALKYEERLMAKHSLNYKDSEFLKLFLSYIDKIRDLGIPSTLYGVGGVSAFDQLIVDMGYMGTSILVNSVIRDGLRYDREVTKNMCDKFFDRVRLAYDINDWFSYRDSTSWFPSNLIEYRNLRVEDGRKDSYKDYSCEHCINSCKVSSR